MGNMSFSDGSRIKYSINNNASLAIDPITGWVPLSYTILLDYYYIKPKTWQISAFADPFPGFLKKTLDFCNFARVLQYFLDDLNRF
jgi:hypothetical protein